METKIIQEQFRPLPSMPDNHCFGCSAENLKGLQMQFHTDETRVVSWLRVKPHMCGWSDMVHGGIVCTILDEAMSWSAIYLLKKIILTKNMSVDFLRPVFLTDELRVEGQVGSLKNEREAVMEGLLYNGENQLCARSSAIFALMTAVDAKKFPFFSEEMIQGFDAFIGV